MSQSMQLEIITQEPPAKPHPTPILFVHGAWHGAWCWAEHFLPHFAERGYSAHALSLRGHGASAGRAQLRRTRIADYVADVAQVAGQLNIWRHFPSRSLSCWPRLPSRAC